MKEKELCRTALELAAALCGEREVIPLSTDTAVSVPAEIIKRLREEVGNPGTIEERVKFLRELDWSYNWAVGMCKLTRPDWDKMPEEEKEKCIDHMLRVLAERAF
ncbi:MAG: hypothetical protein DRN06_07250 [Thermoprotei archaeon]|nr:MAG: hypothetical protein DRN06_07250 [Thermoprotei archaeon]